MKLKNDVLTHFQQKPEKWSYSLQVIVLQQ